MRHKTFDGKIKVRISGADINRFLNRCIAEGVSLYDIIEIDSMSIECNIDRKSYRNLLKIAKKTFCEIKKLEQTGIIYILMQFKYRYMLVISVVLCAVAIFISTSYMWKIEVVGCKSISQEKILGELYKCGVRIGAYIPNINPVWVKNEMLLNMDELSWIAVNIKGSYAEILVEERVKGPDIIEENEVADLVASKDGLITKMNIVSGNADVKEGETVIKGQRLVSGEYEIEGLGIKKSFSQGKVYARTWYNTQFVNSKTCYLKDYTKTSVRYAVLLAGLRINLYNDVNEIYIDKEVNYIPIKIFGMELLPITIIKETCVDCILYPTQMDEISIEAELIKLSKERLLSMIGSDGEVNYLNISKENKNGAVCINVEAECVEQIAKTVENKGI